MDDEQETSLSRWLRGGQYMVRWVKKGWSGGSGDDMKMPRQLTAT
jgi:hypothetical protein